MKNSLLLLALLCSVSGMFAQQTDVPDAAPEKTLESTTGLWMGFYTKYRITEKMFYYGEYHYRRRDYGSGFVGEMAQVYLRFGLTYLVNKNVELTGGVVTPLYWAPKYGPDKGIDKVVPQYRLWEQLLLVQQFNRLKLYHQFRFEQRWRRDYAEDSPFDLTHRFRYRITAYYPLNKPKLMPKTFYLSFYEEIFMQAGKTVTYDHFEDNRVFLGVGYILNENIQVQAGYMWTYRHNGSPYHYESRHIPRISVYHNFDFYGRKKKREELKPLILQDNL